MNFGLANPLVFTPSVKQTTIPGTTRLVTVLGAPEGLLFKQVTSIQDAVACGGIMLYNEVDSHYLVLTGNSLLSALKDGTLGDVLVMADAPTALKITPVDKWKYGRVFTQLGGGMKDMRKPGLLIETGTPVVKKFFAVGSQLHVYGVVVSSTDGVIISHPYDDDLGTFGLPAPCYSTIEPIAAIGFITTEVPLNEPFAAYFNRVLPKALEIIPAGLREYYKATYVATMDAAIYRADHPTVAVTTYWKNSALWSGEVASARDVVISVESFFEGFRSSQYVSPELNLRLYASEVTTGGYNVYITPDSNEVRPGKCRIDLRPGSYHPTVSKYPMLGFRAAFATKDRDLTVPSGEVGGLKVGVLKDLHVLKRSLVDELLFADVVSPFANLGELVNDTYTDFGAPELVTSTIFTTPASALADARPISQAVDARPLCIFSRGTLPALLENFSRAWDAAAEAAAES